MRLARTGAVKRQRTLTAAAHAHGFTDDELTEAAALLGIAEPHAPSAAGPDGD